MGDSKTEGFRWVRHSKFMAKHLWFPGTCSTLQPCVIETSPDGRGVIRYVKRCRHHFALVETRNDREIFDEIVLETREQVPLLEGQVRPEPLPRELVPPRVRT